MFDSMFFWFITPLVFTAGAVAFAYLVLKAWLGLSTYRQARINAYPKDTGFSSASNDEFVKAVPATPDPYVSVYDLPKDAMILSAPKDVAIKFVGKDSVASVMDELKTEINNQLDWSTATIWNYDDSGDDSTPVTKKPKSKRTSKTARKKLNKIKEAVSKKAPKKSKKK